MFASSRKSQLREEVGLELVGERAELEQACGLGVALEERNRPSQEVEVELDLLDDARPADLDDDLAPVLQQRGLDLGDRRGRERLAVDAREDLGAKRALDHRLDLLERQGRHLVDELPELLHVDVRQQIRARGEQLSELDEGGPELLECEAELAGPLGRRLTCAPDANLAQHAQQPAPTRDACHFERALQPSFPGCHPRASCGTTTTPCLETVWVGEEKDAGSPLGRRLNLLPRDTLRSMRGGLSSEVKTPMEPRAEPERSVPGRHGRVPGEPDSSGLEVARVAVEEAAARHGRRDGEREEKQDPGVVVVLHVDTSSRVLEADVLERFGRTPVEAGRCAIVAAARRQVSLGDPGRGSVTERRKLFEARLGRAER